MTHFNLGRILFDCQGFLFLLMFQHLLSQSIGTPIYLLSEWAWISMTSFLVVDFKLMALIQLCTLIRVMADTFKRLRINIDLELTI